MCPSGKYSAINSAGIVSLHLLCTIFFSVTFPHKIFSQKSPPPNHFSNDQSLSTLSWASISKLAPILIPRAHDPSGLRQGSRTLALSNTRNPRSNLANLIGWEYLTNTLRMLRKSGPARALDPYCRPEGSWGLGTRMISTTSTKK